jgi:hypothetical protein
MVWIDTSLETSLDRASQRERAVDPDFIQRVYERTEANKPFYRGKFQHFVSVNNDTGELDNNAIITAYKKVSRFFHSPLENPIGTRQLERMRAEGHKYLSPGIYSPEDISNLIGGWYVRA